MSHLVAPSLPSVLTRQTYKFASFRCSLRVIITALAIAAWTQATIGLAAEPSRPKVSPERLVEVYQNQIYPLLMTHCADCHSPDDATAGIAFKEVTSPAELFRDRSVWESALETQEHGVMPPEDFDPHPSEAGRKRLMLWLSYAAEAYDSEARWPGPSMVRRLNRHEYSNTLQDLLRIDFDAAAAVGLPEDASGDQFDTMADALEIQPLLFEKYVAATDKALDRVLSRSDSRRFDASLLEAEAGNLPGGGPEKEALERSEDVITLRAGGKISYSVPFPEPGTYEIRFRGWGAEEPEVLISVNGDPIRSASFRRGSADKPTLVAARTEVAMSGEEAEVLIEFTNPEYRSGEKRYRSLSVKELVVIGPVSSGTSQQIDNTARRAILVAQPRGGTSETDAAREVLSTFAVRAFRRPVGDAELVPYLNLFEEASEAGKGFEPSIRFVIRTMLLSPHFLFRVEQDRAPEGSGEAYQVSDYELASRLSYLLWSTMPDDELLELADAGRLHEPKVLGEQIQRMLEDSRIDQFVTHFAGQWLGFRDLDKALPDQMNFPRFTPALRTAMAEEAAATFRYMVREDRSLTELIHADYVFLNRDLFAHYFDFRAFQKMGDYKEVQKTFEKGGSPRLVQLKEWSDKMEDPETLQLRGGVLTQGAFLVGTSHPDRTAPSARGAWVLDRILGTPPPPPPPNAGQFSDEETDQPEPASFREKLNRHASDPACAGCHHKMDPLGFALEGFDAVGQWRDEVAGEPLDVSGELPDGSSFNGPAEMKQVLLSGKKRELVIRNAVEKLLSYALGREVEHYDEATVRKIIDDLEKNDDRFQTLLRGVIQSFPFQYKTNSNAPVPNGIAAS